MQVRTANESQKMNVERRLRRWTARPLSAQVVGFRDGGVFGEQVGDFAVGEAHGGHNFWAGCHAAGRLGTSAGRIDV